jgi:hypothetical protein
LFVVGNYGMCLYLGSEIKHNKLIIISCYLIDKIQVNKFSIEVNNFSIQVNNLSIQVNNLSIEVNNFSIQVNKFSILV